MEQKLNDFRARKRRQQAIVSAKQNVFKMFSLRSSRNVEVNEETDRETLLEQQPEHDVVDIDEDSEPQCCSTIDWIQYLLMFVLWLTLYVIFIQMEFGAVYFIVTALVFICVNTRTRRKKRHEVSAYSVFNKNCESIDGTLKAEQLEKQMVYGRLL